MQQTQQTEKPTFGPCFICHKSVWNLEKHIVSELEKEDQIENAKTSKEVENLKNRSLIKFYEDYVKKGGTI